jgi:hypothetical protein
VPITFPLSLMLGIITSLVDAGVTGVNGVNVCVWARGRVEGTGGFTIGTMWRGLLDDSGGGLFEA